jgi:hypothetical protein
MFHHYQAPNSPWNAWDFISVSQRHAESLESDGLADRVMAEVDGVEQLVGWKRRDAFVAGTQTPAMMTCRTMHAVANGKDSPLTGAERREVDKFYAWPLIGDTKAVCVRPRISEADRLRGEKLLRRTA